MHDSLNAFLMVI